MEGQKDLNRDPGEDTGASGWAGKPRQAGVNL